MAFQAGAESQWERALGFLDATAELNYMSQIVFMLFEDPTKVSQMMKSLSSLLCVLTVRFSSWLRKDRDAE